MPGVAKYLRTKPENTLCRKNIWNLKIVLLIAYIKLEFTYLKRRRKWLIQYNFHDGARATGSKSMHFEIWHIVKMLLQNSWILRFWSRFTKKFDYRQELFRIGFSVFKSIRICKYFLWPCDNRYIFGSYFEMFLYQRQQPLNQKSQVSIYYITFLSLFLYYTLSNTFLNFDICSVIYI
jgi:hypothetical protein